MDENFIFFYFDYINNILDKIKIFIYIEIFFIKKK